MERAQIGPVGKKKGRGESSREKIKESLEPLEEIT